MQNNNIYETKNDQTQDTKVERYGTMETRYQEVIKNKKTILLVIFLVLGLLFMVALSYLFYKNKTIDNKAAEENKIAAEAGDGVNAFFDIHEILSTIDGNGRTKILLKLDITLRMPKGNINAIKTQEPVIRDIIITYVRGLRVEDMQGSFGIYKLRKEILLRINDIIKPAQIDDVLFTNILMQ